MNKLSILKTQQKTTENKGTQSCLIAYKDNTSFNINPGVVHIQSTTMNGIYYIDSQLSKTISSISPDTQYVIYIKPPTSNYLIAVNEVEYSTTMPTLDLTRMGQYHPTNTTQRCIGFIRSGTNSVIKRFVMNKNEQSLYDGFDTTGVNDVDATPSNVQTTYTVNWLPFGNIQGMFYAQLRSLSTNPQTLFVRTPNSNTDGQVIGRCSETNGVFMSYHTKFMVDSNKQIQLKQEQSTTNPVYMKAYGFILPQNIYA